jgi:hypothetical protein
MKIKKIEGILFINNVEITNNKILIQIINDDIYKKYHYKNKLELNDNFDEALTFNDYVMLKFSNDYLYKIINENMEFEYIKNELIDITSKIYNAYNNLNFDEVDI